jgi:hypothetical protein
MMKKHCTLCREDLPIEEFNKKKGSKDGLQNVCRECNKKRSRQYYAENRDKHLKVIYKNKKKYMDRAKVFVLGVKSSGCASCEETEICCLDLHHFDPKKKDFLISKVSQGGITSLDRIKKELAKCVVLCSNCHRKVHAGLLKVDKSHLCEVDSLLTAS